MSQRDSRLIGGIYRVGQVITSGEMLTTWTAYNRNTGDVVGLLTIESPPHLAEAQIQHVLQPIERRRLVQSPNVLRVYEWGLDGSRVYIATDPPRGITLRHVLDSEYIDIRRAIDLARQVAQGVRALQEQGIFGVDLRPQLVTVETINVVDRVRLDDIGLRPLLHALGYIPGQQPDDIGYLDPRYVAPEFIQGGPLTPACDVYQIALLLFELVTGRLPFVGRNSAETGILQNTAPVPRMIQFKHDTPLHLQAVIDRALAKNPVERYPTVDLFLAALDAIPLPASRMTSSGEWLPPGDNAPTVAVTDPTIVATGNSMTREMRAQDISLSATLIEGRDIPAPGKPATDVPPGTSVYAYLCFEKDGVEQRRLAITEKNVIVGRTDPKRGFTPDIDLTALDPRMTVSRQHVRIRYEESFFYIEDLKSRNRTKLGELTLLPLKPEILQHGDVLLIGSVRLVFRVPGMQDRPVIKDRPGTV